MAHNKYIRYVTGDIFSCHWRLGCVLAAFGCGLRKLLADGVQSAGGLRTVSVVIPNQKRLLSPRIYEIGNLHGSYNSRMKPPWS